MRRKVQKKKKIHKVGEPPGSLIYTGDRQKEKTKIKIIDYNEEEFKIEEISNQDFSLSDIEKSYVRWIDVFGLAQVDIIEKIGNQFNLHPLVLEDILNPNQRAKLEDYGNYILVILKKLIWNEVEDDFEHGQISLILGQNFVISFQEHETELFKPIYERIQVPRGKVRTMGSDYLLYALIDLIVDNYFIVLEIEGEKIEKLEDLLIKEPKPETLQMIYHLKRSTIELRKLVWPIREVMNKLQREQSKLLSNELQLYLRDIYDHIFRIVDVLESYRDIIFGMLDMYLSSVSNRMNDIMKVLTIISTIFIPLSFLAGFYGMNFRVMPELSYPIAYPLLILVMLLIALTMLYFFKRKRWI